MTDTQKELIETSTWVLYQRGVDYNNIQGLYLDTDKNNRFYDGDQWYGLQSADIEKVVLNFIKPIVRYKVNTIHQNLWKIIYNADNVSDSLREQADEYAKALSKRAAVIWEKTKMDTKGRQITRHSCINSEGIIYVDYDKKNKLPINEVINKNDIIYGNEQDDDIQAQPYIIIKRKMSVIEAVNYAKSITDANGNKSISEEQLKLIVGDSETTEEAGDKAKIEVNDLCTMLTKFYKDEKTGEVHFDTATRFVDLKENVNLGIKLYPIDHYTWDDVVGYSRGEGLVKHLIDNQIEVNKTAMRRAIAVKMTAFPQRVALVSKIRNKADINKVGTVIEVEGNDIDDARKAYDTTSVAQISPDAKNQQDDLIAMSRELEGAGDIATGDVNPESASGRAILAVQQASKLPLNEYIEKLKQFFEDLAAIWLEYDIRFAEDTINVEYKDERTGEYTSVKIDKNVLEQLKMSIKVDITPKSSYDRYAQEQSIENLFTSGAITLEEYANALDDDSVMPKQKILDIIEKRQEAAKQINQIDIAANKLQQQFGDLVNAQ